MRTGMELAPPREGSINVQTPESSASCVTSVNVRIDRRESPRKDTWCMVRGERGECANSQSRRGWRISRSERMASKSPDPAARNASVEEVRSIYPRNQREREGEGTSQATPDSKALASGRE